MENSYLINGSRLTTVIEESAPQPGQEVCIDGRYYAVVRVVRHITMCPPWRTNVHLKVADDQDSPR